MEKKSANKRTVVGIDKVVRRPTADGGLEAVKDHFGGYEKFTGGMVRLRNTSVRRQSVPYGFSKKLPTAKGEGDLLDVTKTWSEPTRRFPDFESVRMDGHDFVNQSSLIVKVKVEPQEENIASKGIEAIRQELYDDIDEDGPEKVQDEGDGVKNTTVEVETETGTGGAGGTSNLTAENSNIFNISGPSCSTTVAGSAGIVNFKNDVSIIPTRSELSPIVEADITPRGNAAALTGHSGKLKGRKGRRKNMAPRKLSAKAGVVKRDPNYKGSPYPWTALLRTIYKKMGYPAGSYSLPKSDKEGRS